MKILVIDAQGGGIGKQIVTRLKARTDTEIYAASPNPAAVSAMKKAGADQAACGENAVVYLAGKAQIIVGPMGIVMPNAMLGEISPAVAEAVASSDGVKVLIPFRSEDHVMVGIGTYSMSQLIDQAVDRTLRLAEN